MCGITHAGPGMVTTETISVQPIGKGRLTDESDTLPFICGFADAVRAELLRDAGVTVIQKGERILAAGDRPDKLCIILSGMVELRGTIYDPDCGVLLLTRGDLIFPMAVLHDEPCLTSATALSRCRLLMLTRSALLRQADAHAEVALALARVMGAQWRMAVRQIIDLKCRSAAERLTAFLLRFVDYSDAESVELPFPKSALAARLGISRETLSRAIQVVADNGVVLRGSRIIVRDRSKAEDFCGPEPYVRRGEHALDVHAF